MRDACHWFFTARPQDFLVEFRNCGAVLLLVVMNRLYDKNRFGISHDPVKRAVCWGNHGAVAMPRGPSVIRQN